MLKKWITVRKINLYAKTGLKIKKKVKYDDDLTFLLDGDYNLSDISFESPI